MVANKAPLLCKKTDVKLYEKPSIYSLMLLKKGLMPSFNTEWEATPLKVRSFTQLSLITTGEDNINIILQ